MKYYNLQQFISDIEAIGELYRVKAKVDPILEISEITDRISKTPDGGKAILFENTGTDFPVLINAFGSVKRMCLALGVKDLDDVGEKINSLFSTLITPKESLLQKLKVLPVLKEMSEWFPKRISKPGKCQEMIHRNPDLDLLPILKCWPNDGGRFITLPIVITNDPETNIRNVGMYRMQVFEKDKTGMHWHKHKVGARHFEEYKKQGKKMPVAVVLGGDPIYTYVATAPLPDNIDEFLFAGFLRNKRVEMVKCITQDLEVPADADFVIEGYVDPTEDFLWEGPFGDHTGFYSLPDWYPAFHITCITHKKEAIYPATIVGIPPQEDYYIGKATERIFLNPIKYAIVPEIVDMDLPAEGVAHNLTIVRINKRYSGQGQKVINSLWGAGQMMFNKVLIVIDKEVKNYSELAQLLIKNVDIEHDITLNRGPLDVLDHAATKLGFGSKIGIDATTKFDDEKVNSANNTTFNIKTSDIKLPVNISGKNISLAEKGLPILIISSEYTITLEKIQKELENTNNIKEFKILLLVDKELIDKELSVILWIILNNIDPIRDNKIIKIDGRSLLLIDGRRKTKKSENFHRNWPNIIVSNDETIKLVDSKWEKYNLGEFIPSPSLKFRDLLFGNEAQAFD